MDDENRPVQAAIGGNAQAFEALYREHAPRIVALLTQWTRNRETARDLAQDTWLKAWRGLSKFRAKASFSTWLCQIARRTAQDWIRGGGHGETTSIEGLRESGVHGSGKRGATHPALWDAQPDPLSCSARSDSRSRLEAGLEKLPLEAARLLALRDLAGVPYRELAQALDLPVARVRVRVHRARMRLRAALLQDERRMTRASGGRGPSEPR